MISRTVPQRIGFEPCWKARNTGLPALQKSVSKLDVVPHRRLLRKRVIAQRMNTALVSQGSGVAKRDRITVQTGDTFEQCGSATPESPLTIKTPVASASIRRRLPEDDGTGQNFTGFWISSARVTCWWSGNWTGCLAPFAMYSRSWSGSANPGQASAV